ncbi:Rho termination protein [Candidatus Magnetomorum sp. HK-1]|nr:Rho termination protein [Candidatus Magnetomorum sp. HK-1]
MGGKKKKEVKEKPLDKMTSKELRETALTIPEISGVHGMNKSELLSAIKEARGIVEDKVKKSDTAVRELKKKIVKLKDYKEKNIENLDKKQTQVLRRRMNRLKKRTRKAA